MSSKDGRFWRSKADRVTKRPIYARVLRLKHIRPGPWWCFLFLEGSIAVAGVLVLADRVNVWALVVMPVGVAIAVKLNDVIAGALPPAAGAPPREPAEATPADHPEPTQTPDTEVVDTAVLPSSGSAGGPEPAADDPPSVEEVRTTDAHDGETTAVTSGRTTPSSWSERNTARLAHGADRRAESDGDVHLADKTTAPTRDGSVPEEGEAEGEA